MPRLCSVCTHAQHQMMNYALAVKQPVRRVARQYGVSKSALARHWTHHRQAASLEVGDFVRDLAQANAQLERLLREITQARGLTPEGSNRVTRTTSAPGTDTRYPLPAWPLACPDSTGPAEAEGYIPFRQRVEPIRHPYVPRWLPFRLQQEFLGRFRAAMQRAKARRGGGRRWRSHLDEVLTTGRILGGLHTTYKYGRTRSAWGRSMRGRKGQKALQRKVAESGWNVSAYFAQLGRRGGRAKARKRYQPYEAWQQELGAGPQQEHQPKTFLEW